MIQALTSVSACAVFLVLLIAFAEHLLSPRAMADAMTAHRTLPGRLVRPVSIAATTLEGALAAALGIALATGDSSGMLTAALAAGAGLLTAYAAYAYHLLRSSAGRAVPCGCSRSDAPISGWVVLRAAALAALAMLAALRADAIVDPSDSLAQFTEAGLAGATFGVLLWVLPEAMIDPRKGPRREL